MATPRKTLGAPAGRLAQLIIDAKVAEPYVITDKITVAPLTKARSQALADALHGLNVSNAVLQQTLRATPARPEFPAMPQPPEKGDTEALGAYDKAISSHSGLVAKFEKLHAEWSAAVEKIEASTSELTEKIAQYSDDYARALFGAAHEDVTAFFEEQPYEVWNAFIEDIKDQFGVTPRVNQVPDDGRCALCGHVEDPEQAGKAPESST